MRATSKAVQLLDVLQSKRAAIATQKNSERRVCSFQNILPYVHFENVTKKVPLLNRWHAKALEFER
jgi:hypothetical protein